MKKSQVEGDVLSLSKGWNASTGSARRVERLGDLCDVITKGTTPTTLGFSFVDKGVNFVKIESIDEGGSFLFDKLAHVTKECHISFKRSQLSENDILFSIAGALGRVALVSKDILPANTNQALAIIRLSNLQHTLPSFVVYCLKSELVYEQINKFKAGVAQLNLSLEQIRELRIPIPPLPEQKRIVAVLDETFAALAQVHANAERNRVNAREVFEAELNMIFENGKDWDEKSLFEVGETQTGTTPKTSEKGNYGDFIPFIKPADIDIAGDGEIRYDNEGLSKIGLQRGRLMPEGSVLMVCIGASIGKVGYTDRDVSCNQQINTLAVNKGYFPKFFYYAMRTKNFYNSVIKNSAQATLPIINKSKWGNLAVRFPKSLAEQRLIVQRLDGLAKETRRLEEVYERKVEDVEELRKSVLQKAFQGEL